MSTHIKLEINTIERNAPGGEPYRGQDITETFDTDDDLREYIIDRYGRVPRGHNKVYVDQPDGSVLEIGIVHTYWAAPEYSGDNSVYRTDWIMITDVVETPHTFFREA